MPPSPPNASPQWTVVVAEDDTRTLSQAKLVELHRKGDVTDATLVWRDGMAEWLPVSAVPELAALVKPPAEIEEDGATTMYRAASVPPPPPAPAPQPSAPAQAFQPPPQGAASPFAPAPQGSQSPFTPAPQGSQAPFAAQQQPQLGLQQLSVPPGMGRNAPTMPMLPAPQLDANGRPIIREASIIGLPTQAFMAQVGGGRRKKRLFLVAGLVVAAAIGGGAFAATTLSARDRAASELAFSKLSGCLIGTAPTGKETASSKFRNIQLAVMGTPVEKRAKGSEQPWPGRCAPIAHELSEAAKGLSGREALVETSEALAKFIAGDPASTGSFKDPIDKVWAQATAANLVAAAAPGVPAPPAAATPMSDEALRDLPRLLGGNFTLSSVRGEAYVGTNARFLIDQRDLPGGPQVCTVTAADSAVACKKVSAAAAKVSPGLRLGGTADEGADLLLFAGDHGQLGTFRGEDTFGDAYVVSSYARKEGASFVLARSGTRDVKLIAKAPGKPSTERPLLSATDIGNPTVTVGQFWEWLAYRSGPKATPPSHLMLRKLSDTGEPSAPTDVGELEDGTPGDELNVDPRQAAKQTETDDERQMVGCRTADATMVRLRGTKQDYVSFFQAGKWSPVAKSPSKGGAFSCHATEATSTRVQGLMEQERNFGTIHQTKCSLSGCTAAALPIRDLVGGLLDAAPVDLKAAQAVEIDGKLLVVWNAGYNGGLRMRIGPMASIRDATDVVIADQRDEKSALKLATVTDIRLIAAKGFAILFLATPAGTKLLRIDPSGKLTPITSTNLPSFINLVDHSVSQIDEMDGRFRPAGGAFGLRAALSACGGAFTLRGRFHPAGARRRCPPHPQASDRHPVRGNPVLCATRQSRPGVVRWLKPSSGAPVSSAKAGISRGPVRRKWRRASARCGALDRFLASEPRSLGSSLPLGARWVRRVADAFARLVAWPTRSPWTPTDPSERRRVDFSSRKPPPRAPNRLRRVARPRRPKPKRTPDERAPETC